MYNNSGGDSPEQVNLSFSKMLESLGKGGKLQEFENSSIVRRRKKKRSKGKKMKRTLSISPQRKRKEVGKTSPFYLQANFLDLNNSNVTPENFFTQRRMSPLRTPNVMNSVTSERFKKKSSTEGTSVTSQGQDKDFYLKIVSSFL